MIDISNPATISQRLLASITTLITLAASWFLSTWCMLFSLPTDFFPPRPIFNGIHSPWMPWILAFSLPFALVVVSGIRRAAVGMWREGLYFASEGGTSISFWHCELRIVLGLALMPLCPISLVFMLRDKMRRSVADRVCNTLVCRRERRNGDIHRFAVFPARRE